MKRHGPLGLIKPMMVVGAVMLALLTPVASGAMARADEQRAAVQRVALQRAALVVPADSVTPGEGTRRTGAPRTAPLPCPHNPTGPLEPSEPSGPVDPAELEESASLGASVSNSLLVPHSFVLLLATRAAHDVSYPL